MTHLDVQLQHTRDYQATLWKRFETDPALVAFVFGPNVRTLEETDYFDVRINGDRTMLWNAIMRKVIEYEYPEDDRRSQIDT